MSEELALRLLILLGSVVGVSYLVYKGSFTIIANLEKRNQKLTDELITAKTQSLEKRIEELTTQINELTKRADQLREDLDAEKEARIKSEERAARAEYLEANARKELEKKQIEVDTLKGVLSILSVTLPDGTLNITLNKTAENNVSTDELTAAANKVVNEIKGR